MEINVLRESGGSDPIGLCRKRREKERFKAGNNGNTSEEKERTVERQSGGELWGSKGESNERTSRLKETRSR